MRDVEGGQRRAGRRRRRIIFVDFELFLAGANEPQNLRHFALIIGVTGDAARETEINQSAVVCVAPIDALISSHSRFFDRFSGFEAVFWRFWGKF